MIFVALGTQDFQFNRLLTSIDSLIFDNVIKEEVFAQTGFSSYVPKYFKYKAFMNAAEFNECLDSCSLLITHAGTGTIVSALKKRKKVITMPRLKEFGEHVDNHQVEIASLFSNKNLIFRANNTAELKDILLNIEKLNLKVFISGNEKIISIINEFILKNFN